MGMVGPGDNPMWWALGPYGGASARQQQMAMAYENARLGKQGQIGAAELGAAASMFGAKQGAAGSLARQGMAGEQGMEQQRLVGEQNMNVAGLRARTELGQQNITRELGMKQLGQRRSELLPGGGGMEGAVQGSDKQKLAWESALKRLDAMRKDGFLIDPDTGKELTPEQESIFTKHLYSQELGFFGRK